MTSWRITYPNPSETEPGHQAGFLVHCSCMSDLQTAPRILSAKRGQWSILIHGLLVFSFTGALALAAGAKSIVRGGYVPSAIVSVPYALALLLFATLLLLFVLRVFKSPIVFETLFALTMLSGTWFLADIFFPPGLAIAIGSAVILLRFAWKSVFTANLSLVIGIAGFAASLASGLSANAVLVLLTVLSFYDIVAVYRTKHMVRMFRALASRGALFAFKLTPLLPRALIAPPNSEGEGMLLGTGDIALPAMLAVAALRTGPSHAVAAFAGAMLGFVLMVSLYFTQTRRAPMPALPPIALGSMLAYLVSLFIFSS